MGLNIKILIFDPNKDNPIREHFTDFSKKHSREWAERLIIWAVSNGYSLEMIRVKNENTSSPIRS